jgi:hypothetical protein
MDWDAAAWALAEYGQAELGHAARTKRLVRVAADLMLAPTASVPKAIADPHQSKAAYRLLSNQQVSHDGLLSGHTRRTAERCQEHKEVLLLQDTTTLAFHSRRGAFGLGPVNDQSSTRGFLAHSSLAVARETREVLGVLHQHVWVRDSKKKNPNETGRERKQRKRESEHWADNQRAAAELLRKTVPGESRGCRVLAVFDREGDIFEAIEALKLLGHSFIIRAEHNRLLDTDDVERSYSLDQVERAPVIAHKVVELRSRPGRSARTVTLEVRAMPALLRPPKNRGRKGDSVATNLVLARELAPPPGVEPLCWYLVTDEPIETPEQVLRIVDDYTVRWIIEEFHMGLKTGCACEDRQMETAHALMNFVAVATPMACKLLQLRDAARRDVPASKAGVLTPRQTKLLCQMRPRMMAKVKTARELMRVLANLGGFLNRNPDPDPGWRTLWRGFETLLVAEVGYAFGAADHE